MFTFGHCFLGWVLICWDCCNVIWLCWFVDLQLFRCDFGCLLDCVCLFARCFVFLFVLLFGYFQGLWEICFGCCHWCPILVTLVCSLGFCFRWWFLMCLGLSSVYWCVLCLLCCVLILVIDCFVFAFEFSVGWCCSCCVFLFSLGIFVFCLCYVFASWVGCLFVYVGFELVCWLLLVCWFNLACLIVCDLVVFVWCCFWLLVYLVLLVGFNTYVCLVDILIALYC